MTRIAILHARSFWVIPKASFLVARVGREGHVGVFERLSRKRLPIEEVYGPVPARMFETVAADIASFRNAFIEVDIVAAASARSSPPAVARFNKAILPQLLPFEEREVNQPADPIIRTG